MNEELLKVAIDAISESLRNEPQNALLFKERGRLRMMIGDQVGAMDDIKRAAELDPTLLEGLSGEFKR